MRYNQFGVKEICNGYKESKEFAVGQSITINDKDDLFSGMKGHIVEILTGDDKSTDNQCEHDIAVYLDEPADKGLLDTLEARWSAEYGTIKTIKDMAIDYVIMAADHIDIDRPLVTYEVTQQHELQDIYRLCTGVILIVNKFVTDYSTVINSWEFSPGEAKKISGMKHCYQLIRDHKAYNDRIYKAGTYIANNRPVTPTNTFSEFELELKLAGGAYAGTIDTFNDLGKKIKSILHNYAVMQR
jgi:hypothetical protein